MYCIVKPMWRGYGAKPLLFVCLVFCHFYHFSYCRIEANYELLSVVIGFTVVVFFFLCSPASYRLNGLNQKRWFLNRLMEKKKINTFFALFLFWILFTALFESAHGSQNARLLTEEVKISACVNMHASIYSLYIKPVRLNVAMELLEEKKRGGSLLLEKRKIFWFHFFFKFLWLLFAFKMYTIRPPIYFQVH